MQTGNPIELFLNLTGMTKSTDRLTFITVYNILLYFYILSIALENEPVLWPIISLHSTLSKYDFPYAFGCPRANMKKRHFNEHFRRQGIWITGPQSTNPKYLKNAKSENLIG